MTATPLSVGIALNDALLTGDAGERRRLVALVEASDLDHLTVGDHVSFHDGRGFDGMITASTLLATTDRLPVLIGVYLLGLRHPLLAARSIATLAQVAPGRLVLGVGVAGEDRAEVSNSGVDPATRGRRLDETLDVMQRLLAGESVSHDGRFFQLRDAQIRPTPVPRVPVVIGGQSDAALRRAARYGDGWLGIFCSPRRFGATVGRITEGALELGRPVPEWFGLTMWCGFGTDEHTARARLGDELRAVYKLPPERFEHVTAAGTPADVAERVLPYVEAGARHLTLVPVAASTGAAIDAVAEVARLLRARVGAVAPLN